MDTLNSLIHFGSILCVDNNLYGPPYCEYFMLLIINSDVGLDIIKYIKHLRILIIFTKYFQ